MSYKLSDLFLGDFPVTERFGASPATYIARYNISGFPGVRFKMPSLTPILAAANGYVHEIGFEEAGKGKYLVIVHDGFLTVYGHLNDIQVQKEERVIAGQLIGHSNQSGLAEYPCLYFGIAPSDNAGNKTEENQYGGFIDPFGNDIDWDLKHLKEPMTKADITDVMEITAKEYTELRAQATNYKVILNFLKNKTEFDAFLKEEGRQPVNVDTMPENALGGQEVVSYLNTISEEFDRLEDEIDELKGTEPQEEEHPHKIDMLSQDPRGQESLAYKPKLFVKLWHGLKKWIFNTGEDI